VRRNKEVQYLVATGLGGGLLWPRGWTSWTRVGLLGGRRRAER